MDRWTSPLGSLFQLVVAGDVAGVSNLLAGSRSLASAASPAGASRQQPGMYFFSEIAHYVYAGDTPLHMAGAAFQRRVAEVLMAYGADSRARNRRGAEPLHYAADANHWNPNAQADTITYLVSVGADPNAADDSRGSPLHRAVRTRSATAVETLLDLGADPRRRNGSGSTPLHLAVQTTGRGGSGSDRARAQQAAIVRLLIARGARPMERDGRGRTAYQAATNDWVRGLISDATKRTEGS